MSQNRFNPTNEDSLLVHHVDVARVSVVKNSLTTEQQPQFHDLEQTIAITGRTAAELVHTRADSANRTWA